MKVYTFTSGTSEGVSDQVEILGGKGAGLAAMCRLGVAVPPGFTIPAEICRSYFSDGDAAIDAIWPEIERGISHIETQWERTLGDPSRPLLLSVRSGASAPMPGVMTTVLNLGLNDETRAGLEKLTGDRYFVLDSYRRFVEMYAETVLGVDSEAFTELRRSVEAQMGQSLSDRRGSSMLATLGETYERKITELVEQPLPQDPRAQLREAIAGTFRSWNTRQATLFRRLNRIDEGLGTAVNVQAMVFGNLGPDSGTGVAFTRCPNSGERRLVGEYLANAQGEDVVGGVITPQPLSAQDQRPGVVSLEEERPRLFAQIRDIGTQLEGHFKDALDLEFTVERDRVWLLQARPAKRAVGAAVRIAVEMHEQGLLDRDEALVRVEPSQLTRLHHRSVDADQAGSVIARGLPASPGAVSGVVVFSAQEAVDRAAAGERVILVRVETSAEDFDAIRAVVGVLTARGGMTSHAALIARGMGQACVTGCADIVVNERARRFVVRELNLKVRQGDPITLDGTTGEVFRGLAPMTTTQAPPSYSTLMKWADERRRLGVRSNVRQDGDTQAALRGGAGGIGLCQIDHLLLVPELIGFVHALILADDKAARRSALDQILEAQRRDLRHIFEIMQGRPVAVRLFDLPPDEFLPRETGQLEVLADRLHRPLEVLAQRIKAVKAQNPTIGQRGCRIGLRSPAIYKTQIRAIFEAAVDIEGPVQLEILVPFVMAVEEMRRARALIETVAERFARDRGVPAPKYAVGAMIEVPRACLLAGRIAQLADFLVFGPNDLTVTTFGLGQRDGERLLPHYVDQGILAHDPFVRLDIEGVGALIELGVERARQARPDLPCALAGEHLVDADSIELCHRLGMDFISCPPHQLPVARLAAAQAAIRSDSRRTL